MCVHRLLRTEYSSIPKVSLAVQWVWGLLLVCSAIRDFQGQSIDLLQDRLGNPFSETVSEFPKHVRCGDMFCRPHYGFLQNVRILIGKMDVLSESQSRMSVARLHGGSNPVCNLD